jgi:equilibrative nucleoside transporter 1/2/3
MPHADNTESGYVEDEVPLLNDTQAQKGSLWIGGSFFVFGMAMLSPFSTWTQLNDYFKLRLQNSSFQGNYEVYINAVYQVTNILALLVILYVPFALEPPKRAALGTLVLIAVFALSGMLSYLPLGADLYFVLNLVLVGFSSIGSSFIASVIGMASSYPSHCISMIKSGQGMVGLIPTVLQFAFNAKAKNSIWINMIAAIAISTSALLLLRVFHAGDSSYRSPVVVRSTVSRWNVWKSIALPWVAVFINFCVTLAVFPAITSSVSSTKGNPHFVAWHFLIYTSFDWLGKSTPALPRFQFKSRILVLFLTTMRFLFLPLFLTANISLEHHHQVYKNVYPLLLDDTAFMVLLAVFAFTSGFLNSLCFIQASDLAVTRFGYQQLVLGIAGDFMVFGLTLGLACGSLLSFGMYSIACQCNPF